MGTKQGGETRIIEEIAITDIPSLLPPPNLCSSWALQVCNNPWAAKLFAAMILTNDKSMLRQSVLRAMIHSVPPGKPWREASSQACLSKLSYTVFKKSSA
jgi:hypothetical protein